MGEQRGGLARVEGHGHAIARHARRTEERDLETHGATVKARAPRIT